MKTKNLTFIHPIMLVLVAFAPLAIWAQTGKLTFPPPSPVVSTVPANGDVNPYGVIFTPVHLSPGLTLQPHDILVSNFNNALNLQGLGTTVERIGGNGESLFFQSSWPVTGLTAALGVVQRGFVFVGSTPTTDGTSNTVRPGSLLILDGNGNLLQNYADTTFINGPWGMAIDDLGSSAHVFVSNVLAGTITRMDVSFPLGGAPVIKKVLQIGSEFSHRTDPAALVLGPSGLAYDRTNDILYVANSADETVYALSGAKAAKGDLGSGTAIYKDYIHLHGPAQMAFAPNGDLLVANSDGSNLDVNQPSEIVEFTTSGQFVQQFSVDPNNGGAFGVAVESLDKQVVRISAVDDDQNKLTTWTEILQ